MNKPFQFPLQEGTKLRAINNGDTFDNITVNKTSLLGVLQENLSAHNEVFNAATQAYYAALSVEISSKIDQALLLGNVFKDYLQNLSDASFKNLYNDFHEILTIKSAKPTSYEDFYKTAIRKVELSNREELSLNDEDFQRYIMNNWEWKANFLGNAGLYCSGYSGDLVKTAIQKFNK